MVFFPLPRDATARVRALFEAHGSQGDVAKVVNRSKPWVSKHLSLTDAKFDERVRELLTEDQCADVETLNGLNQLAKVADAAYFDFILADVRASSSTGSAPGSLASWLPHVRLRPLAFAQTARRFCSPSLGQARTQVNLK